MRILTLASVIGLAAANPTSAQQAPPPMPLAPPAPASATDAPARHITVRERFAMANTTHDGKLTPDQAKAGFPAMARLFDVIDRDHKGFITMDDIKAYYDARRARQAAATQPVTEAPH
jgi:hypothetical protein